MMSLWFATAFLTGLISSLHCVGMCGPLVAALPVGKLPREQRWRAVVLYHAGRIMTYSVLGALAGTLSLGLHLLGWQRPLAIGCGVVLLMKFVLQKRLPTQRRWPWLNERLANLFRRQLRQSSLAGFGGLGILNGLLPCGFTYLALAGTLTTNTPMEGGAYMLLFGVGTLPTLVSVNLLASWLTLNGRRWLNRSLSIATVAVALLLIGRGVADYRLPATPTVSIPLCHGLPTK